MKHLKQFLILVLAITCLSIKAQTNVTEQYVVNAGFDNTAFDGSAPQGWKLELNTSGVQSKISIVEKGGGVIAGSQPHWQLWQGSGALTGKAFQQNSELPVGRYKLTANVCSSFGGSVKLYLNNQATTIVSGTNKTYEVEALVVDGNIELGLNLAVTSGGTIDFDSFQLFKELPKDDDIVQIGQVWHDNCVADTLATGHQKWYNKEELRAAILAFKNAGDNVEAIRSAIALMEQAHNNFIEICATYMAMYEESADLYQSVKSTNFALKDSIQKIRTACVKLYIANTDNYEQAKDHLASIRNLSDIYNHYVSLGKAISVARNQLNATNYAGKDALKETLSKAEEVLSGPTSIEAYNQATKTVTNAQATYLKNRPSEWVTIQNGLLWKTIKGTTIQAHAPGFLRVGDIWYMCGEDRANWWNPDVNLYSSTDLVHWKFERKIIQNGVTTAELGSSRMIERPKLLYNEKTGKYVVWCHYEASNYGASEAACFECDSVNGAYEYVWSGRPLGVKSRDCNVFQDTDGTAYFISTTEENRHLGLFRLSDDYHEAIAHTELFSNQGREAPAIVRIGNRYFMFNSACSGWDPNQCKMSYTSNLTSGWTSLANVGNPNSFDTQAAAILEIKGTKTTTYLYVGDRWQDPGLPETKTIIFPISFNGTSCTFKYHERFDINFVTGEWRETPTDTIFADRKLWKVIDKSSEESGSAIANYAIDGNVNTMWHSRWSGSVASAPHHITIDMGKTERIKGFLATPRMDSSTNGLIRKYTFEVSNDGEAWVAQSSGDWMPYCTEVNFKPVECRYIKLICREGTYASIAELNVVLDNSQATNVQTPEPLKPNKRIVKKNYVNINGQVVSNPTNGIYIEQTCYADGTSTCNKVYVKE